MTPAGELVRGLPTSRVDRYPLFRVEGPVPGLFSRGCPDELGKSLAEEIAQWAKIIKAAGIRIE